ncbi:MAG: YihY family inner membrane protein [Spirochaetes bacterium]|nr:YihY family inner membrane protein [Spirochaetota bacterium]
MKKLIPKFKNKISELRNFIIQIINQIYRGEEAFNWLTTKIINTVKVFIVASRKFMKDDCLTKSSSIAYTTIVSLIPTLAVVLTIYSIFSGVGDKKDELFRQITLFLIEHNIKVNVDPFFQTISTLIDNAAKIGGIGAVVLAFSATAVLRTLEKSLNDIFRVSKQRSMFLKVIYYWAALTLGPIMIIAATAVATQISSTLSAPHLNAIAHYNNSHYVVGNKATILFNNKDDLNFTELPIEKIDFDNQHVYSYNPGDKQFKAEEFRIELIEYKRTKFSDIAFVGQKGFIIGDNGIILKSNDAGKSWLIEKWGNFSFNDIAMVDDTTGFIAANDGYLLKTNDAGKTWNVIDWENVTSNLNAISFYKDKGIIVGDRSYVITTTDRGKTWKIQQLAEGKYKKNYLNFNNVQIIDDTNVIIVADEGFYLTSSKNFTVWTAHKFKDSNLYAVYFMNSSEGFMAGEKADIFFTADGGEKWTIRKLKGERVNELSLYNNLLWAIGNNSFLMLSKDMGTTWQGLKGSSILVYLLNFFAPFFFIWILFLMCYMILPNTKVPLRPAAIGASFTSAVWVIFILLFIVYIKAFAKSTFAIYGALAAFPIFLLVVYSSAVIILYGAEISYVLMNPLSYKYLNRALKDKKDIHVYSAIALLHYIYKKFESGKGACSFQELLPMTLNDVDVLDMFIELFIKEKFITHTEDFGIIPANASKNITIAKIIDTIYSISLDIPAAKQDKLKSYLADLFKEMKQSIESIVQNKTLADVIRATE